VNKSIIKRAGIAAILVATLSSCSSSGSSDTSEGSTSETASESSETSTPSKIDSNMNVSVECSVAELSGTYLDIAYEVTVTNYTTERVEAYVQYDVLDQAGEYFGWLNESLSLPPGATRTARGTNAALEAMTDITGDLKCEVTEALLRK